MGKKRQPYSETGQQGSSALEAMTVEELRSEIYRLRHIRTDLQNRLKAREAVIQHLNTAYHDRLLSKISDAMRERMTPKIIEALRDLLPEPDMRRLR
jgi:hypothetical protein